MQLTMTKRSSHGLTFIGAYTWSKNLTTSDTSGPDTSAPGGQDFFNRAADYSVTEYHIPHDFKLSWLYDVPFGPAGRWGEEWSDRENPWGWSVGALFSGIGQGHLCGLTQVEQT